MIHELLGPWLIARAQRTPYYHLDGYMERWWLVGGAYRDPERVNASNPPTLLPLPLDRFLGRYVAIRIHHILRSDADDLHDHPGWSLSWLLKGFYWEETPRDQKSPGVFDRDPKNMVTKLHRAGDLVFRRAWHRHRLMVNPGHVVWSCFVLGPSVRRWGFHTIQGWKHGKVYVGIEKEPDQGPGSSER